MKIVSIILLSALVASCDLFTTRTPQAPDLGNTFIWTPAATPSTLLDDFTGTLQAVDPSNYARCFVSAQDTVAGSTTATYTFSPRLGLDASSRSLFDAWGVQSEQNFLTKLRASLVANPRMTVTISNLSIDQTNASSALISADYTILLPLPSNSTLPSSISGSLKFQSVLVSTEQGTKEWRILNWTDLVAPSGTSKCFTDLKVQLAS